MAKEKSKSELTGKLKVSIKVTNFNGADDETLLEQVRTVEVFNGEDLHEAAIRSVKELSDSTVAQ